MDLDDNINRIESNIYTIFAETSSTTRYTTGSRSTSHLPQGSWHAHLGITGTSRPPIHSEGSHQTSCNTIRMGLESPQIYTLVHQGTLHYKFLISPQLPQGHSLPLQQLIPLHINTCTQSHQYLEYLLRSTAEQNLQSQHHQQRRSFMPSASASATAHTSSSYFKNFSNIFSDKPSTSATPRLSTSSTTRSLHHHHTSLTTTKSPIHVFTDSTSALSLSNKLGLNKQSKHIALRYLFAQDIQATGLVNIQRVTLHNNLADIYTKCVTSPVLERQLRRNGIIEQHIKEGEISYFHILELAEQYGQYLNVTSDEDVEHTKELQQRKKNNGEYTREQRL